MPPGVCFSYIKVNRIGVPFELHVIPNKVYDEDDGKEVLTTDWITRKEWKVIRNLLEPVVENAARLHVDISEGLLYSPPDDPEIIKADNLVLGVFLHLNTGNRIIPSIESSLEDPTSPYWWIDSETEQAKDDEGEDDQWRPIQLSKVVVKVCILGGTNEEDPVETNESFSKALEACKKNYSTDYVLGDYDQGPYDHEVELFQLGRIDEPVIPGINEIIKNVDTTSTDPKIMDALWDSMNKYCTERDDDTDSFPDTDSRCSESDDDEVDEDEELPDIDDGPFPAPIRPQPVYALPLEYTNKITTEPDKSKRSDSVTPTRSSRSSGRGRRRGGSCMELVTASGKTIDVLNEIRKETRSKTTPGSTSVALKPSHPKSTEEKNTMRHIESSRKSSGSPSKKKKKKKRRSSSRSPHPTRNTSIALPQPQLPVSTKEVRRSPDVTSTTSSHSPSKSRRRSNSESTTRPETAAAKRNLDASADSDGEVVITKEKARPRRKERQLLAANKIKIEKETSTSPQRKSSLTASPDRRTKEKEPLPEWDPEMPILQPQPFHYTSDLIISTAPSLRPERSPVSTPERDSGGRKSALSWREKRTSRRKSNSESQDTEASTEIRKRNRVTFSETVEKVKSKKPKSRIDSSMERVQSPSSSKASLVDHITAKSPVSVITTPSPNSSNTTLTDTSLTRAREKEIDDHGGSTKTRDHLKKRKKRDKKNKELRSKSTDPVTTADPSKVSENIPRRKSSNEASSSTKRKRKKKRLEREVIDHVKKTRSERVSKRGYSLEKPIEHEPESAKDATPKTQPATPVFSDSDTPAAVRTRVADEIDNPNRPSSATTSSFIASPDHIPLYPGKSLIEVINELSNSSLDDRSKSPSVSDAPERSKSPAKEMVEESRKPERNKSPTTPISTFGSSESAFVCTSSVLTSTATAQMSTELEASNPVIIVVPAPLKVSQTTQTEDTDMDIEMYPSSRFLQPRKSSGWTMKVLDGNDSTSTSKGLKALALVSLAYGDDDIDSVAQEDLQDSDYDRPNRIMAELHEAAERSNSPPPIITVDDSDPEDVYSLFDLTAGPSIKREAELCIKKEVEIPAKYDLFEETTCMEDPFMRVNKIEIDSQPEFSANNVSDMDELQNSPDDFTTAIPYSPPSNFYEPEEDESKSDTGEREIERTSPEPCCSKSLRNIDSLEMPPPSMPPPKSPRKPAKHKKETDQSKALVPAVSKNVEQAALAAVGVKNQPVSDLDTFDIMCNPKVLRHTLNKLHKAQTEAIPEDEIRRAISGDFSDVKEVCSVRYASKKPEKRKRNSQGIKLEDEDSDDSQSHEGELDPLAAMGSELLSKEVARRSKDARKARVEDYIPQGDQYDLSQRSMCLYDIYGPAYVKASRSHKQWKQTINDISEEGHRKIFESISLKVHGVLNEHYDSERFEMWKRNDPDLTENYMTARDLLFKDNTLDYYSDFIISEFDSMMDAVTEKYHEPPTGDPQARSKLETLVVMPETLTLVLAHIAKISKEQAALVLKRGKAPFETLSSETPRRALPSSHTN